MPKRTWTTFGGLLRVSVDYGARRERQIRRDADQRQYDAVRLINRGTCRNHE